MGSQEIRRLRFHQDLRLEIGTASESEIFVAGASIAIGTPVAASSIRIQTPPEAEVRALVLGEDAFGVIEVDLKLRFRWLFEIFPVRRLKRIGRIVDLLH